LGAITISHPHPFVSSRDRSRRRYHPNHHQNSTSLSSSLLNTKHSKLKARAEIMLVEPLLYSAWRSCATAPRMTSSLTQSNFVLHASTNADHLTVTIPPFLAEDDTYPSPLHKIHVVPMLTEDETSRVLELAKTHAQENKSWDKQDSTRHVNYNTVDFGIEDAPEVSSYLREINFEDRVFGALSDAYDVDVEDMSFLDFFCASYEAADESEKDTMDRLEFHRDGSLLSFSLLLSSPSDFEGGGTIFDALRDVPIDDKNTVLKAEGSIQPPQAGYATLHSGKLLHGGHVITKGQRIVLVGFVDVDIRNMKDGALFGAAKEWGRNDVRQFWNKRRLELLKNQREIGLASQDDVHPRWQLLNDELLPQNGRSCVGPGVVMSRSILDGIKNRAGDEEKMRMRRLKTEDELIRQILLPRDLRGEKIEQGELREVEYDENGIPTGIELVEDDEIDNLIKWEN
jgi:hypothetical protein